MKVYKYLTFCVLCLLFLSLKAHKSYLSLTQINYNQNTKAIEVTMNLFMDDVQEAINKKFKKNFELNGTNENQELNAFLETYLRDNFKIKVNKKSTEYNYLGKEYEGDLIYVYVEIKDVKSVKQLEILNQMLMQYFPDQKNYIKVKINNSYKSLLLTQKEYKGVLKF